MKLFKGKQEEVSEREGPVVHQLTTKKSLKRSTWQLKGTDHLIVQLHWMHPIIESVVAAKGFDPDDRDQIFRLDFSDAPFDGYEVALQKRAESESPLWGRTKNLYGHFYRIDHTTLGSLEAEGFLPDELISIVGTVPDQLYFSMTPTRQMIHL